MPIKVLYLSYKRRTNTIPVSEFLDGLNAVSPSPRVRDYTKPGVVIELRDGQTGATRCIGSYEDICQYLRRINESSEVRTFSDNTGYLDPNPPDDY